MHSLLALQLRRTLRTLWNWFDLYLGRGSYSHIRTWLAQYQEYSYFLHAGYIRHLIRGQTRWLDAGCGHQSLETRLEGEERALVSACRLSVGCDAWWQSLSRHRSLVNRVVCDAAALPFADRSFTLVTLNMVAEHLEQPQPVIQEIARVLDDEGVLLIHTPNALSYPVRLTRLTWRLMPRSLVYKLILFLEHRKPEDVFRTYYRANTKAALSDLTSQVGMYEEEFKYVDGRAVFFFFAPLAVLEILLCRLLRSVGRLDLTAGTIIAIYRKRCASSAPSSARGDIALSQLQVDTQLVES